MTAEDDEVNESEDLELIPACPADGFSMTATIVGWRCPICGLASLPAARVTTDEAKAAHPAFGRATTEVLAPTLRSRGRS